MAALGFLSGLFESIGVGALIPLFSFILKNETGQTDPISDFINKFFSVLDIEANFLALLAFIILLFLAKSFILLLANYINATITSNYEKRMRAKIFHDILYATWPFLLKQRISYLEKVMMEHVTYTSEMLRHISGAILLVTSLVMYTYIAMNISLIITLLTLSIGGLAFLLYKPLGYKTRTVSQRYANDSKKVANIINENMIGMKTAKATASEEKILDKGNLFFESLKNGRIKMSLLNSVPNIFIQPVSIIFILIIFAFSYSRPDFNLASFAVTMYLIQKIFAYIQNSQGKLQSMYETIPYVKSVVEHQQIIKENNEIQTGKTNITFEKSLAFEGVNFSYNQEKGKILHDIDFSIHAGEIVGLIGPSGAGKTTIVDLLLKLFEPDSGQITCDNVNIKNFETKSWRKMIGYVSQDIFLLNDTIENNIRFYNDSISKEKIIQAAKMANILAFIQKLPENFATTTGERGVMLSAGQRQRIILARVLARDPKILVLDEATSALDNESEIAVQDSIQKLKGKITVLTIAHRLSTIMNSDKIIAIDSGKIVEFGKPEELLRNRESYFYKIYHLRES